MSCQEIQYLVPGVSNAIEFGDSDNNLHGLYDESNNVYLNAETATFAVKVRNSDGSAGATVSNGTGSLTYVTGTNGCYRGFTSASMAITDGSHYYIDSVVSGKINDRMHAIARMRNQ